MESEAKYVKMKSTAALLCDENPEMMQERADKICTSVTAA